QRYLPDLFPDRIADRDAKGRARVSDIPRIVVTHHRLQPGAARHDSFWAAAETGEKVRFDKPGDDADIGVHKVPVDQRGHATMRYSKLLERGRVLWLVIDDPVIADHLGR